MKRLVAILCVAALASPAFADILWDQMTPGIDSYGAHSTVDRDDQIYSTTTDDFQGVAGQTITEVEFAGWSYYGNQYINGFRITIWSDVPATVNDASHPGDLLYDQTVLAFTEYEENRFVVDIPDFETQNQNYWIGIQGDMVDDGWGDVFYLAFADRNLDTWNDNAAFECDYFGYAPWANWGWPDLSAPPDLYEGIMPAGWANSADTAFRLVGVPEPAAVSLLAVGGLALLRRRR